MLREVCLDSEANNLLNNESLDYSETPYKLKDSFKLHSNVVIDMSTGEIFAFYDGETLVFDGRVHVGEVGDWKRVLVNYEPVEYTHLPLSEFPSWIKGNVSKVVGHNIINYDLLVYKLWYVDMGYSTGVQDKDGSYLTHDTVGGEQIEIEDTYVMSQTLNPDRFGGHSLDNIAKLGGHKGKFDYDGPWCTFNPIMLYYNIVDVQANIKGYHYLKKEWGDWDWSGAYQLEKNVAEIITRQEHYGFKFDAIKAKEHYETLSARMAEIEAKVEPLLPRKQMAKSDQPKFPAKPFTTAGDISSHGYNHLAKLGYEVKEKEIPPKTSRGKPKTVKYVDNEEQARLDLQERKMPDLTVPMKLSDHIPIKEYVVSLGWAPTAYKDRDLTIRSTGKVKLTKEEFVVAVDRYVNSTIGSQFEKDRCEHLKTTPKGLRDKLLKHNLTRPLKVLTSPTYTIDQEKTIDPALVRLGDKVGWVKDLVLWLTYNHRKNAVYSPAAEKKTKKVDSGWLVNPRLQTDGRIATPANTCGAASGRFKHIDVANIPRVTSVFGGEMRELFGVEEYQIQVGYDADGLEARNEGHYTHKYDKQGTYVPSLTAEKPNDLHTRNAELMGIRRDDAKTVKYACMPTDNSEILTKEGFKGYLELSVGQEVLTYNTELDHYEWKPITDMFFYRDVDVLRLHNKWFSFEVTENHKWWGYKRTARGSKGSENFERYNEKCFFETRDINNSHGILNTSHYFNEGSEVLPHEAALVAWLLSDGYYKWADVSMNTSCRKGKKRGVVASISQSQRKYFKELEEVLEKNSAEYVVDVRGDFNTYRLSSGFTREFLDRVVGSREQKHDVNWEAWLLKLDQPALQEFLYHFRLADGHDDKGSESFKISQNKGKIADALVLVGNLTGHRVTYSTKPEKCLTLSYSKKPFTTGQRLKKEFSRNTNVYCISNENKNFVMKQEGKVTLTGNTTYGATAGRLSKQQGWTMQEAENIYNDFWEASKPLKDLKEAVTDWWKSTGKKSYIIGLDKRKLMTRSEHALLNTLFQSAGAIAMKRAMVLLDMWKKQEGLFVDVFCDKVEGVYGIQQIAYHDEGQEAVNKDSVQFKCFSSKEEAEEKKPLLEEETGNVWSDIFEAKGKWWVGYSRVGELAVTSITEAGRYYNMNVDLTAGYMLGKNWKDCH